jgi:ABC-type transport system involved in multi-copper enzyme maturation permease subunit
MLAAYFNSLHEAVHRRMALVTAGIAVVVAICFNWFVHLPPAGADGIVLFGTRPLGPESIAVPALFVTEAEFTGFFWLFLGVLAGAPLLISALERGWTELTFSKGTARWRIMTGRYLGGVTLYLATMLLAAFPLALRLWVKTGISPQPLLVALLLQAIGFAALIALAMLATLLRASSALPIVLALLVWMASPQLYRRKETLYPFLTSSWSRHLMDGVYAVLPKTSELDGLGTDYIQLGRITAWWPVWTTLLFAAAVMATTLVLLRRKSL